MIEERFRHKVGIMLYIRRFKHSLEHWPTKHGISSTQQSWRAGLRVPVSLQTSYSGLIFVTALYSKCVSDHSKTFSLNTRVCGCSWWLSKMSEQRNTGIVKLLRTEVGMKSPNRLALVVLACPNLTWRVTALLDMRVSGKWLADMWLSQVLSVGSGHIDWLKGGAILWYCVISSTYS